jgi:hypothetical protein
MGFAFAEQAGEKGRLIVFGGASSSAGLVPAPVSPLKVSPFLLNVYCPAALLNDLHLFDISGRWTELRSGLVHGIPPSPRSDANLAECGNKLYVFGGRVARGTMTGRDRLVTIMACVF